MGNIGKSFALLLVLLFIMSLVLLPSFTVKAQTRTLIVPEQYPTIQSAVSNASAGDKVFVKKGEYYCYSVEIRKPLSLIGEDWNKTIIHGEPQPHGWAGTYNTIKIYSSDVSVCNLTFVSCVVAITVYEDTKCSNIQIIGNKFLGNPFAISAGEVSNLVISKNYFSSNRERGSTEVSINSVDGIVSNNVFSGNLGCLELSGKNVKVFNNQITNNTFGISLKYALNANVFANNITFNTGYDSDSKDYGYGVEFDANSNDSAVYDNYIVGNTNGINLRNFVIDYPDRTSESPFLGSNNLIYNNNFINNSKNANVEHKWSGENSTYLVNYTTGTAIVSWDNGAIGNYWFDYNGGGTYDIDQNNIDHHPLTQQVDISLPTITSTSKISPLQFAVIISAIIIVVALAAGLLVYFKKHKWQK